MEGELEGVLGSLLAGEPTRPPKGASSLAEQQRRPEAKRNATIVVGVDIERSLIRLVICTTELYFPGHRKKRGVLSKARFS